MSTSENFCFSEDIKKRNSTTNKEDEMQEYENRILQCVLAQKITPMDLKRWLPLHFLKPEFVSQIHMVLVYNEMDAIIVTKDKNVYSLDYSDSSDLHTAIYPPKKIKELCGKNIKTFDCGYLFLVALTEEGEIYYWNSTKKSQEDLAKNDIYVYAKPTPTRVADLSKKRVMDIACGQFHCLALTSDGKVYAWRVSSLRMSNNEDIYDREPRQVKHELTNKNVVRIACGLTFNIVITDENKVYGWGDNKYYQISTDQSQKCYMYPHEITTISDKIVKVTCGYDYTLALTNKGEIYAWGNNDCGQIGIVTYDDEEQFSDPIKVNVPEMGKVLDITAFVGSSVAIGYDGTIYVWGLLFSKSGCSYTPLPMKFSKIDTVAYKGCRSMQKPLTVFTNNYKYVEEVLNILESIGAAFDDPLTSDLVVLVKGQPIYVHTTILKIRCDYFKKMFQYDWAENVQSISDSSPVFTVSDKFSYIVYKAFLKYLYTGKIDLSLENALELMELANMYCETNLKKNCCQIIKQDITLSNVAFFYDKAVEYNAKDLEEFCFQFVLRHMTVNTLLDDIKLDMNMQAKFMQIAVTQSRDTIVSISSKKSCSPEDVEKRNSETTTNIENKMQKYEKRILQSVLADRIILMDLNNWIFFRLLEPEFILQIYMVMIFQNNRKAIIATKDKNVYSLDYYPRIYFKYFNHTNLPRKINELCGKNIKKFDHNNIFMLALTEEGEVYSCKLVNEESWDKEDPMSIRNEPLCIPEESTFTQVASLREKYILDIACGYYHCLVLASDGKVYAWRLRSLEEEGEVWINDEDIYDGEPRQVKHELTNKNVVLIACGSKFNIVITDENKVYGWGDNSRGQISTDESQQHYVYPHEITTISNKIVKVTCGYDHTLILTNEGEIYAWGVDNCRLIGNKLKRFSPIMVNVLEMGKVLDIAVYNNMNFAVGYNRIIYMWGSFYFNNCLTQISRPFPTKFTTINDVFTYFYSNIRDKPLTVFTNIEQVLNILESVEAAFDDPLTSDFTIQIEGQSIYVHKAILKIRCDYFKKMFQHDWAENIQSISDLSSVFIVSDNSYIVYKAFLKYLYTGTIDLSSENVLELLELANKYCEINLIKDCSQIIKKTITVSNVVFFYNKAIECNAKELEEFCFQFALLHMTDVILSEDYIKLDMNIKDNFIRKAAKENAFRT